MFLKSLKISSPNKIIREIIFHKGLNLIVDESETHVTGNNVGKTTVLKLIDFCLGASPKNIYSDPENKQHDYLVVKDYLIQKKILITLELVSDLDDNNSDSIVIERNFLARKDIIRKINGLQLTEDEFEPKLTELIFPNHQSSKPTFRQIISHNIRYKDISLNNTLKTLDSYTADAEYETLYLFLLGCEFSKGNSKQEILARLKQEENFKSRLEREQTKTAYEAALELINADIDELNKKKSFLNLNQNFEDNLNALNQIKFEINGASSSLSKLNIRKQIIIEAQNNLKSTRSDIDIKQLDQIYSQAKKLIGSIQKSFEELVVFHNQMIDEKIKFVTKELPIIDSKIKENSNLIKRLLQREKELSQSITKTDSFEELEKLIISLNEKYQQKGEYENIIAQLIEVELNIKEYNDELKKINDELFSDDFEQLVKGQLVKFNKIFSSVSNTVYGERYAVKYDIVSKKGQRLYKFNSFNANLSSGKKQGEISCFDIAYTLFADEENIPCLHFLLNDKKELVHDNQLVRIADFVNENNIQFIASILKDKLPQELNQEKYFVVKLSESDRLLRVEQHG